MRASTKPTAWVDNVDLTELPRGGALLPAPPQGEARGGGRLNEFQKDHLGRVGTPRAQLDDPGVAAGPGFTVANEGGRFEAAHLGHLHHDLTDKHYAAIGRLDVLMVPVDGSYTIAQDSMINVIKLLRARIVLPMHYFGPTTLQRFLSGLGEEFDSAPGAGKAHADPRPHKSNGGASTSAVEGWCL